MSFRRITADRGDEMKIGYARVSTQDQDLALQLDALAKEGCEKIFQEKASGAQRDRPELKAALAYMRKGDTLVVWKLDRLARSMKQLIETIESFQDEGIGLKSLQDPIDTSSPSGKLVFHIFAALAEFERGVIRERTTAGLRAARERGRVGGRPPALSAKDLQAAKAMLKDSDITVAAVAKRLNVAPSTLYRHIPHARSATAAAETKA
jgi:DNA invertase Pin-like site-specific DNA recombinase